MSATSSASAPTSAAPTAPAPVASSKKRTVLGILAFAAVGGGLAFWLEHRGKEATDDAQVEGHIDSVAARISGQVLKVDVTDNQIVNAGDVLVEIDPATYAATLDVARADLAAQKANQHSAEAQLALVSHTTEAVLSQASGSLAQASSGISAAAAAEQQARADILASQARLKLADLSLSRALKLRGDGAISQAEVDNAQAQDDQAKAELTEAQARLATSSANVTGSRGSAQFASGRLNEAKAGPQQVDAARAAAELAAARVAQAEANLKIAELNLSYTKVLAPRRGVVSRRTVEIGVLVSPERPLLAVVPLDDVWVVANYKEDQIADMKPGQHVDVKIDAYEGRTFSGHVESLAGASGAKFSLLPPDNATGNFIKVVQRIPVLIRFDDVSEGLFRPGMSAYTTVHLK